ncbi:MAG: hypothetical protein R2941_23500 [Desulfobacterales bacterium]
MSEKHHTARLFLIGSISITAQVIILRELNVAFYGVELVCILAMGIWLFWTAMGVLAGRKTHLPSEKAAGCLFLLFAFFLLPEILLIRSARAVSGAVSGTYLSFGKQMTVIFLSLLPAGFLTGLLFQWAAKRFVSANRTLALAYAIESAGGLIGGLASFLFPLRGVGNFTAALVCAMVSACGALLSPPFWETFRKAGRFSAAVFIFPPLVLLLSPRADEFIHRLLYPDMLTVRDSPSGRIRISLQSGLYSVFENDALLFDTESTDPEVLVHPAALQCLSPERVLIAGGGFSGITAEILKHRPGHTDIAEINPVLDRAVRKHLPPVFTSFLQSPGIAVHHADPRQFLKDARPYDLILAGSPEPDSGQSNRFYTLEFFQICARKLKPGGVLAFGLASSENLWTPSLTMRNAAVYAALRTAFADVLVLSGTVNTVIASNRNLIRDPELLIARFQQRNLNTRLMSPAFLRYLHTNDRFAGIAADLADQETAPNTDFRPICYQYTGFIWLSRFIPSLMHKDFPSLSALAPASGNMRIFLCLFSITVLGLILGAGKSFPIFSKSLLVFLTAFAAMVMEGLFILRYQAQSGAMFLHLGILLMIFMAGLAAGSLTVTEFAQNLLSGNAGKQTGRCLILGFALLCLAFEKILPYEAGGEICLISVFLFLTAFFLSGIFAWTGLSARAAQQFLISPLYAADLMGACLGSLLGSFFLIPFLGMAHTAAFITVLLLAAVISP